MYGYRLPALSRVCEKSPRRSSSVGTRTFTGDVWAMKRFWNSWFTKKKSFDVLLLILPGTITGPPNV